MAANCKLHSHSLFPFSGALSRKNAANDDVLESPASPGIRFPKSSVPCLFLPVRFLREDHLLLEPCCALYRGPLIMVRAQHQQQQQQRKFARKKEGPTLRLSMCTQHRYGVFTHSERNVSVEVRCGANSTAGALKDDCFALRFCIAFAVPHRSSRFYDEYSAHSSSSTLFDVRQE